MKEFLQSDEWRRFQESVGRRTFHIDSENIWANIIEHTLPIVGKYGYIPRGPIFKDLDNNQTASIDEIIKLAKNEKWSWIRVDPANMEILRGMENASGLKIAKAPHDMQPREIIIVDISEGREEVLAKMKSKVRYNIRLAQKHDVEIKKIDSTDSGLNNCIEEFLRLTHITAKRQGIVPHPDEYYRKMLEVIPKEIISLFIAKYDEKIISAAIVAFYGNTATYLHGASDNQYKKLMAPYLIQWAAILEAQRRGCDKYDLGGVKTKSNEKKSSNDNSWSGITKFKTGFASNGKSVEFPGSYDIIVNPWRYRMYRAMQYVKAVLKR